MSGCSLRPPQKAKKLPASRQAAPLVFLGGFTQAPFFFLSQTTTLWAFSPGGQWGH